MRMLHSFQRIERVVPVPGEDRYENDAEHSYFLAMSVWHAIDTFELPLDRDKAIRYALAHDLPEVHAGDTYVFSKDALAGKKERETAARKKLKEDFPTIPDMHEAMEAYERQTDPEAVFVRALDKLLPVMTYLQDSRTLKERGTSFSEFVELKRRTTASCAEVSDLAEQLIALFDQDRARYFGENVH